MSVRNKIEQQGVTETWLAILPIVDAVHDNFVVSCLLKCVLRLEVPRYLARRSSWSECPRKTDNGDLSSGNMFCHVHHRWGESRMQLNSRKLRSWSDGGEGSGVSTEVGCRCSRSQSGGQNAENFHGARIRLFTKQKQ